jgi:hypothetical protein
LRDFIVVKSNHFTKTGLGRTQGKHSQKDALLQALMAMTSRSRRRRQPGARTAATPPAAGFCQVSAATPTKRAETRSGRRATARALRTARRARRTRCPTRIGCTTLSTSSPRRAGTSPRCAFGFCDDAMPVIVSSYGKRRYAKTGSGQITAWKAYQQNVGRASVSI